MERYRSNGGEVADTIWADACPGNDCGIETDRTKAEDRMESGIFVGFQLKFSEYILFASGEAITARTIRRRFVSERSATLRRLSAFQSGPGTDFGHRQEAAVRPTGERRGGLNHELHEALLPKPPAEAGPSKRVYLKQFDFDAHGLRSARM